MEVNYPEMVFKKSNGTTQSESLLSEICNKLFLSLWSYPNVYRDQGGGKEICDLLVVFENHIFIFSDKACTFENTGDIQIDWSRWYKKAIYNSAKQIWGAERWIFSHPDRVFIDYSCKKPFPIVIPEKKKAIVHRIIVAHGTDKACKSYFNGGSGSLIIQPDLIGDMHFKSKDRNCNPFRIGQIDNKKGFIHVFDDITLNIVMGTLDTITDFVSYLAKKQAYILSGKLLSATGEENLLAYYLSNFDRSGKPSFSIPREATEVVIDEGLWNEYYRNPRTVKEREENEISYSWDKLMEKFFHNIVNGTSYKLSHPDLKSQAESFRYMAKEDRISRRELSYAIHEHLAMHSDSKTSSFILSPKNNKHPYYFFLFLKKEEEESLESYRLRRGDIIYWNLYRVKLHYPNAMNIVGIATEPGIDTKNRSEDFAYLDATIWTNQDKEYAQKIDKTFEDLNIFSMDKIKSDYTLKGADRNKPCPCGSGLKYKKCCGKT